MHKFVRGSIGHFRVVYSVPLVLNSGEAGGDLVLLQTFLLFMCKSWYSHANKPVNVIIYILFSLASIQRPGH